MPTDSTRSLSDLTVMVSRIPSAKLGEVMVKYMDDMRSRYGDDWTGYNQADINGVRCFLHCLLIEYTRK